MLYNEEKERFKIEYLTIITIVVVLLAVIIHEGCHVLAAILVGQKPKILGIGFWKPHLSFFWKGIEFRVSPFLLGGYVSFHRNLMQSKEVLKQLNNSKQCLIYLGGCIGNIFTGGISLAFFYIFYPPVAIGIPLWIFGVISITLAVTNLIPFPLLDGWQVFQCGVERIIGRQFSYRTNVILTYGGIISLSIFTILSLVYYFVIV